MAQMKLPPSTRGHWLLGSIPNFKADPINYEFELTRKFGDIVGLRFANRRSYLVTGAEPIRQVLVEKASEYRKAPIYKLLLSRFLGDGLLTSDGEFWKRQRKLSQPAFHHQRIAAYGSTMVEYTERSLNRWQPNSTIDVNDEMIRLTLSIVAKSLFDYEIADSADTVGIALTDLLHTTNEMSQSAIFGLPEWVPTPRNRRVRRATRMLDEVVMGIIDERRKLNEDKGDLLSMLMTAEDEDGNHMTDKQLRDEAVTIVLAGHETTANALTWTWFLLAQHPEIEAKVHEEIDRVLGGRTPTMADLRQLTYTEMVIKEAMRLYPPIPGIARESLQDTTLGDYFVPKGTIIFISINVLHHNAEVFEDPFEFRPERFSKENEKNIPKYAYLPFAAGPRVCIGNGFAMMEAVLVLATIARKYQLRLVPGQHIEPEPVLTLRPSAPVMMKLEPRNVKTLTPGPFAVSGSSQQKDAGPLSPSGRGVQETPQDAVAIP
jgi:cytochrome P450